MTNSKRFIPSSTKLTYTKRGKVVTQDEEFPITKSHVPLIICPPDVTRQNKNFISIFSQDLQISNFGQWLLTILFIIFENFSKF